MGKQRKKRGRRRYCLVLHVDLRTNTSEYRIRDDRGEDVRPINEFLEYLTIRGLSRRTVRNYGFDLLHFWRWLTQTDIELKDLTEGVLLEYVRFQQKSADRPAPTTINHRLVVVRSFYHHATGGPLPGGRSLPEGREYPYERGPCASTGYLGRTRRRARRLRVKTERRVIVPLTSEEVARFMKSFRRWRDLAIVGLMLFCGLRRREVLLLSLLDISLSEGHVRVQGKGRKQRMVPLPPDLASVLRSYLAVERPESSSQRLFLCLKGPSRGKPLTPAGLRSLFRHHRKISGVPKANPHRFRHTFGATMVRAGVSLPALMHLMGHAGIGTTMGYVTVSPQDVWREFQRAVARIRNEFAKGDQPKWDEPTPR